MFTSKDNCTTEPQEMQYRGYQLTQRRITIAGGMQTSVIDVIRDGKTVLHSCGSIESAKHSVTVLTQRGILKGETT